MSTLQTKQYYQRSRIDSDWGTLGRYNRRSYISFRTASPRLSTPRRDRRCCFRLEIEVVRMSMAQCYLKAGLSRFRLCSLQGELHKDWRGYCRSGLNEPYAPVWYPPVLTRQTKTNSVWHMSLSTPIIHYRNDEGCQMAY